MESITVDIQGPSCRSQLTLPKDDHITRIIHSTSSYYEAGLLQVIRAFGLEGVYVDVGAHYGNHTVFFATECLASSVISIEPNPTSYNGLLHNITINNLGDKVVTYNIAIHNSWTKADCLMRYGGNTGSSYIAENSKGQVQVETLDSVLQDIGHVSLIKCDAQFLDLNIILSGLATITEYLPILAIEAVTLGERQALTEILTPLGYKKYGIYCSSPTVIWTPVIEVDALVV